MSAIDTQPSPSTSSASLATAPHVDEASAAVCHAPSSAIGSRGDTARSPSMSVDAAVNDVAAARRGAYDDPGGAGYDVVPPATVNVNDALALRASTFPFVSASRPPSRRSSTWPAASGATSTSATVWFDAAAADTAAWWSLHADPAHVHAPKVVRPVPSASTVCTSRVAPPLAKCGATMMRSTSSACGL